VTSPQSERHTVEDGSKLLRVEDVSEMTGVSPDTLRHWRHQQTGPKSARLGKRIVYRKADVIAWVDAQFARAVGDDL
jgi:predicted DNA-binding transcriptional regulator AlpA